MRFSLKRLLLSTALIAVGCFGISLMTREELYDNWMFVRIALFVSSPIWICAAIAVPFNRTWDGVKVGGLIAMLLILIGLFAPAIHR